MHHHFDLFGWYTESSDGPGPRSTPVAPPSTSTSTEAGVPRANYIGIKGREWELMPYVPADPLPEPGPAVPASVTRRQAKQALALAGLLDQVQPAIDAIEDPVTRALAQIEWDDSVEFQRSRPLLIELATAIGLSVEQLDQLFITAAQL
jgi:hypothetical protein